MNFRLERCEQPRHLKVTRRRHRPGLASLPEPATSGRTILWPRPTLEVTPPSPRAATRTGRARSSPSTGPRLWWTTWRGRGHPCQVFRPLFRTQRDVIKTSCRQKNPKNKSTNLVLATKKTVFKTRKTIDILFYVVSSECCDLEKGCVSLFPGF